MREQPTLIENGDSGASSASHQDSLGSAGADAAVGAAGPSITIYTGGGQSVTLDGDDLLVLTSLVQTVLLLYIVHHEVTR